MTDRANSPQAKDVNSASSRPDQPSHKAAESGELDAGCDVTLDRERLFCDLYQQYFNYAWHSLRRLGVPSRELPDATHQLFVIFWRRLPDLDRNRSARPWVFGIAWRVAIAYHRRRKDELSASPEVAAHEASPAPNPEQNAIDAQRREIARAALQRVDIKHRAVLILHDFDGMTAAAIAEALGIPLNTVYSRLRNARRKFEQHIKDTTAAGGRNQ